jgi:uracil-DNA glycosylase family 4
MSPRRHSLDGLAARIVRCERCPRLREHCRRVAVEKRAAYRDWDYHGKPVPGFGDVSARLWIIGLAPGAHGANRTGRVFTGDRSGDFLYAALHHAGYANQPTSTSRDDGLKLCDCYISAACRCAPPGNKPTVEELANCSPFLDAELKLLRNVRVVLALGRIAWDASVALLRRHGPQPRGRVPSFAHGAEFSFDGIMLIGSYHVSQQNTFTGRLTATLFDEVLVRCRQCCGGSTR